MRQIPTFTMSADMENAFEALCLLGQLTEKPSKQREEILDAALEFSRYKDDPEAYLAGDDSEEETHG